MSETVKRIVKIIALVLFWVMATAFIFIFCGTGPQIYWLRLELSNSIPDQFQVFISSDGIFSEETSKFITYDRTDGTPQIYDLEWKSDNKVLRFDFGQKAATTTIKSIAVTDGHDKVQLDLSRLYDGRNFEDEHKLNVDGLTMKHDLQDGFMIYKLIGREKDEISKLGNQRRGLEKVFWWIVLNISMVLVFKWRRSFFDLTKDLYDSRVLTWNLAKNDFKTKYVGSALGIVWAFIQPIVTIVVYWMVFQFGLKSTSPIKDVPYIIWFISGMICWFFFSEALCNATNCFMEYSYLVKKVIFKVSVLPMVKIISSFLIHIVFVIFILVLCGVYRTITGPAVLQLIYYAFCMTALVTGLSFITSSIVVFFRDLGQIITIVLQIGMWATPIVWPSTIVPERFQFILKLNPMYYVVEGYRDAVSCNGVYFWDKAPQTIYFWCLTGLVLVLGASIFNRMKDHFADVL